MIRTHLYTKAGPLFAAEGTKRVVDDGPKKKFVFIFTTYDQAVRKGQELVFGHYHNVSVYRLEDL